MKYALCFLGLFCFAALVNAQTESNILSLKLNSSADLYVTDAESDNIISDIRVQPGLDLAFKAGAVDLTGELSADLNVLNNMTTSWSWDVRRVQAYRAWLGIRYKNHAVRAGLQNLKFGSGDLIRPLQWFDQESSMDPLLQTMGSVGVCDAVELNKNLNLTVWAMNRSEIIRYINYTKVYRATNPDIGFRLAQKEGKNSLALNFNYQTEISPLLFYAGNYISTTHIKQVGLDGTYDLGPLVWFETSTSFLDEISNGVSMVSCGTDLAGRSKGKPTLVAEHLCVFSHASSLSEGINYSSLKLELPMKKLKLTAIGQYDWSTDDVLSGAYLTLDTPVLAFQFAGYSMPDDLTLLYSSVFSHFLPGTGFSASVILKLD